MPNPLIIGDVVGCYAELLDLPYTAGIGEDDLVVSVGDIVDQGPEPREVVEFFRNRTNSVVLIGKHERKYIPSRANRLRWIPASRITRGPGMARS